MPERPESKTSIRIEPAATQLLGVESIDVMPRHFTPIVLPHVRLLFVAEVNPGPRSTRADPPADGDHAAGRFRYSQTNDDLTPPSRSNPGTRPGSR